MNCFQIVFVDGLAYTIWTKTQVSFLIHLWPLLSVSQECTLELCNSNSIGQNRKNPYVLMMIFPCQLDHVASFLQILLSLTNCVPMQAQVFAYISGKTYIYNNFLRKLASAQFFNKNSHTLFMTQPTSHKNLVSRINSQPTQYLSFLDHF